VGHEGIFLQPDRILSPVELEQAKARLIDKYVIGR